METAQETKSTEVIDVTTTKEKAVVVTETPKVEEGVVEETPKSEEVKQTFAAPVSEPPKVFYNKESDKSLSMEERIEAFMESRSKGNYIRLNDFLKSLYPIPKQNEPPAWSNQVESKKIRNLLNKMQTEGKIFILNDIHLRLGKHHYPDANTMKTEYHSLANLIIEAKK